MDHILVKGESLYKSLDTSDMLSADQLPEFLKVFSHNIPVWNSRLETQLATQTNGDSILWDVLTWDVTTLFLLFMESFTTAIILSRSCYYLFDSHSSDERVLSIVDGTSVLMKFNDQFEIEEYIQVAYLKYRDRQQAYF